MNALSSALSSAVPMDRREREKQRKCLELLAIAERVFALRGFHGASMEEIAKEAEYATGALYRYFESKEVMYVGILERKLEELVDVLQETTERIQNPLEKIQTSVRTQLEYASRNLEFIQIYFRENMETMRDNKHWVRVEELKQKLLHLRASFIREGQKAGIFRKGDPYTYAAALNGMLAGVVQDWAMRQQVGSLEDLTNFMITLHMQGICQKTEIH